MRFTHSITQCSQVRQWVTPLAGGIEQQHGDVRGASNTAMFYKDRAYTRLTGGLKQRLGDLGPIGQRMHQHIDLPKVALHRSGHLRHCEALPGGCRIPLVGPDLHMANQNSQANYLHKA